MRLGSSVVQEAATCAEASLIRPNDDQISRCKRPWRRVSVYRNLLRVLHVRGPAAVQKADLICPGSKIVKLEEVFGRLVVYTWCIKKEQVDYFAMLCTP